MFFIVWRGYGFLVPVLAILVGFVPLMLLEGVIGTTRYQPHANIFSFVSFLAAAGVIWLAGKALNGKPGRELLDPKTGERVVLRQRHDVFWIPFEWWAIPTAIIATVMLFSSH